MVVNVGDAVISAAISLTVNKLGDALLNKAKFIRGVEGQAERLKHELDRMRSFLKEAARKESSDERIENWISDVREIAYDAQDLIDKYSLKSETRSSGIRIFGKLGGLPLHAYNLNKIGRQIESLLSRIDDVRKSRETYGIQNLGEEASSSSTTDRLAVAESRRRLAPWQKDEHEVGLEEITEKILGEAIFGGRPKLSIVTIVGMGGIGKSCLARKIYNHSAISNEFDCRAWVCISSNFNTGQIVRKLMKQLVEPANRREVNNDMENETQLLLQMLHELLEKKRYFIVLDDLWESHHWDSLADAFPRGDKASRLVITSRNNIVTPGHAPYVHKMQALDPEKSWELLLKKAFVEDGNNRCVHDLEGVGKKIVSKCNGLPLAITVVGGLLLDKNPSKHKWERVLRDINIHLGPRSEGGSVFTILELSYLNLPPLLKPCFMCLSFFGEDMKIRLKRLVYLWGALGLLSEESGGETVEDIGELYFEELINRNLVQIETLAKDGSVRTFKMHDQIRDLSITKAKKEMRFEIHRHDGKSKCLDRPRHCVVFFEYGMEKISHSKDQNKHIRSLLYQGYSERVDTSSSWWRCFRLLTHLDFENFTLTSLPDLGLSTQLKYLGLRNTSLQMSHDDSWSFAHLRQVEVLDLSNNGPVLLPKSIWEMEKLRHLYVDLHSSVPLKKGTLKNLETLESVNLKDDVLETLQHMKKLRKLGMVIGEHSDTSELWTSLATLEKLERLNLKVGGGVHNFDGLHMLQNLIELKLRGEVSNLLRAHDFPPKLSYLTLVSCWLEPNNLLELKKLPELAYLKLIDAYEREELVISANGFAKLKVLSLHCLHNLQTLQVEEGGLPQLGRLEIGGCLNLKANDIPQQLRPITTFVEETYFRFPLSFLI